MLTSPLPCKGRVGDLGGRDWKGNVARLWRSKGVNLITGETLVHIGTVVVLRADSPGKAAQWFTESIRES
jgi:hypothetical protein